MKVQAQGYYFESTDMAIDPDGFNEMNSKKRDTMESKQQADIDRSQCGFKEAWQQLSGSQRFQQLVQQVDGEYSDIHQQLLHQCEVVKDLINGSIVGQEGINREEVGQYLLELAEVQRELVGIEISSQQQNKKQQDKIKQDLIQLMNKQECQQNSIDIQLQQMDGKQIELMEQRVAKLRNRLGMQQLKKSNDGYYYKGVELINDRTDGCNDKQDGYLQTGGQDIEAMNIVSHVKTLKTQLQILNGDEQVYMKLQKLIESQEQQTTLDVQRNVSEDNEMNSRIGVILKRYEHCLKVVEELPKLVSRMKSLKQLHNETIQLPHLLDQTSSLLILVKDELQQGSELLELLEQQ